MISDTINNRFFTHISYNKSETGAGKCKLYYLTHNNTKSQESKRQNLTHSIWWEVKKQINVQVTDILDKSVPLQPLEPESLVQDSHGLFGCCKNKDILLGVG
jgi:hypothetical protein